MPRSAQIAPPTPRAETTGLDRGAGYPAVEADLAVLRRVRC
jgi:hypothetical protein